MFDGEAGLVRGYRLVGVAYGVLMALEVFIIESLLDAANTVGVVGLAGFVPAGFVLFFGDRSTEEPAARLEHLKTTLAAVALGSGIGAWAVLDTQPFDDGEHAFNVLTCVGAGVVLFYAFMATVGAKRLLR